eukprot:gene8285-9733_t
MSRFPWARGITPVSVKACDALPQINQRLEQADDCKTHGIHIWDVHQQDLLVGMFHDEAEAHNYKNELETLEMKRQAQSS